jgi:hypothetical protein
LLDILSRLEQHATSHGDVPDLRRQVQQALQTIEFQQLANLFAHQEHQPLLLQFMHPALSMSHTAQVYFRVDPEDDSPEAATPRSYTLVFLLDLTSLGHIRVDATVRPAHLSATISTTTAAVAEFITSHTPALSARLQELGFHTDVHCRAQADLPLQVEDTFSRLLMAAPSHLLDVTT